MCTENKEPDSSLKERLLSYGIFPRRNLSRQEALCSIAQSMARRLLEVLEEIFPKCDLTWAAMSSQRVDEYMEDIRVNQEFENERQDSGDD